MANDNHSYQGTLYTLEQTLFRSITYWAKHLLRNTRNNAFYPTLDDFIQECWAKVLEARARVEEIWADPDPIDGSFRGVCKYVARLCTNALIDAHRYLKARAP